MNSWGLELWDQFNNLAVHTHQGIEFLDKYSNFVKERCTIENEYATKLRRLVKSYQPKKKEEDDNPFTWYSSFQLMLQEVKDIAGQHEVIAENLHTHVVKEAVGLVKDLKEERKKLLIEGNRIQANLQTQHNALDRSKKQYEKAWREAEKAQEHFNKADADLNLSRAEVEKSRANAAFKNHHAEDTKNEYASQLQKTNDLQLQHYKVKMPEVFKSIQDLDERRIQFIRELMHKTAEGERDVFPILNKCLDGVVKAAKAIDEEQDSRLVIERYKSGFDIPGNIPFEDLSTGRSIDVGGVSEPSYSSPHSKQLTIKGTSALRFKKRGGLFGIFGSNKDDYADLPPNQRKKKIQQRLDEMRTKINQEQAARDGLRKMKEVYESNPALGDPASIEGQLSENCQKLEKLNQDLAKLQSLLDEAMSPSVSSSGSGPPSMNSRERGSSNPPLPNGRSSVSDESLSRSASDSSVSNPQNMNKSSTPLPSHGSSNSPESGLGMSRSSLPDSDFPEGEVEGDDMYDGVSLPVLGTCAALYDFDASSEGSIPMYMGEEMYILEVDQGDGWTRVRKVDHAEEGFVPTSYIRQGLYNSC